MSTTEASAQQRLKKHLKRLSDEMVENYREALHAGTPEAVAEYREVHVREIIGRFFPRTYQTAKGAIYDSFGARSASIDCVVSAPNHPLLMDSLGRITTLLVDGVQCAVEVKPDLRDMPADFGASRKQMPEIVRGLEQVRSVKRLKRSPRATLKMGYDSTEMQDFVLRAPTYLLSFEPVDLHKLAAFVAGYYREGEVPLAEQVDWIAVLGVGLLYVNKAPERPFKTHQIADPSQWVPAMVVFPSGESTLENFILVATADEPPEIRLSAPLIERYLGESFPSPSGFYLTT